MRQYFWRHCNATYFSLEIVLQHQLQGDIHCNSITVGFIIQRVLIHFTTEITLILHTAQNHLYLYAASSLFVDKLVCETYQGSVVSLVSGHNIWQYLFVINCGNCGDYFFCYNERFPWSLVIQGPGRLTLSLLSTQWQTQGSVHWQWTGQKPQKAQRGSQLRLWKPQIGPCGLRRFSYWKV